MVDLTITPASVIIASHANIMRGKSGATVTAGQLVYKSSTNASMLLADNNSATAEARRPIGVALHGASTGQPLAYAPEGDVTIGATMTAGVAYYLSDTPGGLCTVADLATGEYPCVIGMAISTTVLRINIQTAGVAL